MIAATKPRALFSTGVWGEAYVDRFLNYSLRTQLSPGNFGAFDKDSLCQIVTDEAGYNQIVASPVYAETAKLVSVECVVDDTISRRGVVGKYTLITACQNIALTRSRDFDIIFFGYADALWSDASYRNAARRIAQGYDAICSFGYPVRDRAFKGYVDRIGARNRGEARKLTARRFADRVYQHLHPMAKANNWHTQFMTHCPSYVLWDVGSEGLLVHAFHLHPVAVRVLKDNPAFFLPLHSTLDEEFVLRFHEQNMRTLVSHSTDEIGVCSLAEDTQQNYRMKPYRPVNLGDLARFAEASTGPQHRENFVHPHRLLRCTPTPGNWSAAEIEAGMVVREVQARLSIPDSILRVEDTVAFVARRRRIRAANQLDAMMEKRFFDLRIAARFYSVTTPVMKFVDRFGFLKAFKNFIFPHLGPEAQMWFARLASPYHGALLEGRMHDLRAERQRNATSSSQRSSNSRGYSA